MLNWTYSAVVMIVSTIPSFLAVIVSLYGKYKTNYAHFKYMAIAWSSLFIGNLLISISYIFLDYIMYIWGILLLIPMIFALVALLDVVSSGGLDQSKMIIVSVISTSLIIFSFQPDAVRRNVSALGEVSPALDGDFLIASTFLLAMAGFLWFFYAIKIHINLPKDQRHYSFINLIGAIFAGPGSVFAFISGVIWFLPGIDYLFVAIGSLLCSFAFFKEPKLGFVLPFKVYSLTAFSIDSGLPVYSHYWNKDEFTDYTMVSGMIKGISDIFQESFNKGSIREIMFEEAILLIYSLNNVGYVLLVSNTSYALRQSLELFANRFNKKYKKLLDNRNINIALYEQSDDIIDYAFPFVISE